MSSSTVSISFQSSMGQAVSWSVGVQSFGKLNIDPRGVRDERNLQADGRHIAIGDIEGNAFFF